MRNLARTWAEDLKGTGIRVNVLTPGAVATELAATALVNRRSLERRLPSSRGTIAAL